MKDEMIKNQRLEIKQLKAEIKLEQEMIEELKLENQQLKNNQRILESENELVKSQLKNQKLSEDKRE